MEVADAADHRRGSDDLIAVRGQVAHEGFVLRVALDERVARVAIVALCRLAVLAEVVDADYFVAGLEQLWN